MQAHHRHDEGKPKSRPHKEGKTAFEHKRTMHTKPTKPRDSKPLPLGRGNGTGSERVISYPVPARPSSTRGGVSPLLWKKYIRHMLTE